MSKPACFTAFSESVDHITLPEKFTYPFYYQPHPISELAAKQLQQQLATQTQLFDAFSGKMFGVLVVQNEQHELGFLSAYSGQFNATDQNIKFVEAISNMQSTDAKYRQQSDIINNINSELDQLQNSEQLSQLNTDLTKATNEFNQRLDAQHKHMQDSRSKRKKQRSEGENTLDKRSFQRLQVKLSAQSVAEKKQLSALKSEWQAKINTLKSTINEINDQIKLLQKRRKTLSKSLQKKLFSQYKFLNIKGEVKDLNAVFAPLPEHTPASGAGDCAAPKLLQYAFANNLTPIAMAEFWFGDSLKSAVRQHKNYYPACFSKCQPILAHMLDGMNVEDNPLLENPAQGKSLPIIYQDDDMLVVNKPAEFLSVPGITIEDSVYTRIKSQFPQASGPLIVHRLDMSTSGLLMVALNKRAHKALQKQFIERTVEKRYVALVEGFVEGESGTIDLPLRLDLDDKPRQLVCYEHGKPAFTTWQVVSRENNVTRLHLHPKTGRTHQLRVHCAHKLGLNMPIVGDTHYGKLADRLHLHAEYLAFSHPITKKRLTFEVPADF
ncbi:RNA pseudouridine synthase [Pseudoalteromonas sp. MMG010]|uniref:RluA family pseudouridine synthase n=1 Tax=Pseudoalteromonas sp. MMG010 TaxID=2822685 RepID=UPI001B3A7906|nr:pseudouridine synthase [Pseudoalteromonas sp. MMG010]MBQ4832829.1 RNA pseudouridine synthase [Pseudoalteromonas sp. MMG010]